MAITTSVTRKFDNNFVQVEVNSTNSNPRYYKVPAEKADSFQAEYIKSSKKMYNWSTILTICSVIGGTGLAIACTQRLSNKLAKFAISAATGILAGVISTYEANKSSVKSHKNMLEEYNAQEIDYSKHKFI